MTTDNRKNPTLRRLISCENKTVRHFAETIRTDIIQIYKGDLMVAKNDDIEEYLDCIIEYINVRNVMGWCIAEVHVTEVEA